MKRHPILTHSATAILAAAVFISVPALAQETPPAPKPVATSPIATAKTIRAKAKFNIAGSDGKFSPLFDMTVIVAGPNQYRVEAIPVPREGQKQLPTAFYFYDGKKQYEYNSIRGEYKIADAPKPGERLLSDLTFMGGLNLLIQSEDTPPRKGVERTTSEEELDGKKMRVTTDTEPPRKTNDGKSLISFTKVYRDAETGLPYRRSEGYTLDGVVHPNLQVDFSGWTFDEPVPPQLFVWKIPDGALEAGTGRLLKAGTVAPDFQAVTPDGKTVRLSDFKGKVVILDFWATWCGPCQKSMPHLEKVYKQVQDKGVAVLALCVWDERAEYDRWVVAKKGTYTFPTAFDPAGRDDKNIAKALYKVDGIPTQYVIDKNGKVVTALVGYNEGEPRLENALRSLGVEMPK